MIKLGKTTGENMIKLGTLNIEKTCESANFSSARRTRIMLRGCVRNFLSLGGTIDDY